jgi:hypothetical protein
MSGGTIFAGNAIKLLKDQLKLKDSARILTGTYDPRLVATEAEAGSIFLGLGTAGVNNPDTFSAMGSGILPTNGAVYCSAQIGSNIYFGFSTGVTSVDGVSISGIAKWNGSSWSSLGVGVGGANHSVWCMVAVGTDLYVGGDFTTAGGNPALRIAKYDTLTSTWSALGAGITGGAGICYSMAVIGTDLYVGGGFAYAGGNFSQMLAKYDTVAQVWVAIPDAPDGPVYTLAAIGTDLYLGGQFTGVGSVPNTFKIAKWNGTSFSSLATGLLGNVWSMAVSSSNELYVGGEFTSTFGGGVTLNGIGKWNGSAWSQLGSGVGVPGVGVVFALGFLGSNLYVGGSFTTAGGNPALRIAKWNGTTWSAMGTGTSGGGSSYVNTARAYGGAMYFGGGFAVINGVTVNGVSKFTEAAYVAATPVGFYQKKDAGTTTNWFKLDIPEIRATFFDPIATVLPTGSSVTIDGIAGQNGDTVLYTNLNAVYALSGVGSVISWTLVSQFDGLAGTSVRFTKGNAYGGQLAFFNGTSFFINDTVRFFDGANGTNFWEMSSIKTASLPNNTPNTVVFSVNKIGTENITVEYSLIRGAVKRVGNLLITHDGTNVAINDTSADLGDVGVAFTADILTGNLRLLASTDNSGLAVVMKFYTKRWSDSAGGPTGIPNYTSALGSSSVVAAGGTGDVQFKGVSGNLSAESNFNWSTSTKVLSLGNIKRNILTTAPVLIDNTVAPTTLFSFAMSGQRFTAVDYSIELANGAETQVGRLLIVHNGSAANISDESIATYGGPSGLGIVFSVAIVGPNVQVYYTSTAMGGQNRIMKYAFRYWD